MKFTIYVQLLNEGTIVYRPVPAAKIDRGTYKLEGYDIFDAEDETWEFAPGAVVIVEKRIMHDGEVILTAVKERKDEG